MASKLTLRIDEKLIAAAKGYAARTGKSVSRIVADLFAVIANGQSPNGDRYPPLTRSLRGVLKGRQVGEADYRRHLEDTHL